MAKFKDTTHKSALPRDMPSVFGRFYEEDDFSNQHHPASLQTPPSSSMSKTSTPDHKPQTLKPQTDDSAFTKQRYLDRKAIRTHMDAAIRKQGSKFTCLDTRQRWIFIQTERDKKLKLREMKGNGSTRMKFPDLHDEGQERRDLDWLWENYGEYLKGDPGVKWEAVLDKNMIEQSSWEERFEHPGTRAVPRVDYNEDSDEDDEEELISRVKDEEDVKDNENNPAEETKDELLPSGKVITRGFCLQKMLNEAHGRSAYEGIEGVVRTWQWVGGKLVVWPLTDESEDGGPEMTERGLKRKADEESEERLAKKQKVEGCSAQ